MAHLALGVTVAFACFGLAIPHSGSMIGRQPLIPRYDTPSYSPVPPSALVDVEFRSSSTSASLGDYVATGLAAEMDLVAQEYGLRHTESFYWGLDGVPLANLTAFADGENVRVLSVERFDGVLHSAQCSNTSIILTFTQEVQFQDVQSAWTWINDADENHVVLVTDSSQCNVDDGDDSIRQPWHVTHAVFDDTSNTVQLDAQPRTWNETFSTWHLAVDSRGLLPSQHNQRRQVGGTATANDSLQMDFSNQVIPFGGGSNITCVNCSAAGQLDFTAAISIGVSESSGSFQVIANDVSALIDLDMNLRAGDDLSATSNAPTLRPLNGWGSLRIHNVVDLTPELTFGIVATASIDNDVTIDTGFDITISEGSQAEFDFITQEADDSGWIPTYTPLDTRLSNSANISGVISPQIRLAYTGSALGRQIVDVGLLLLAPELVIQASIFEQSDAGDYSCGTPTTDEGVYLQLSVGSDLESYEDLTIPEFTTLVATQTLFASVEPTPFFSTCFGSYAPEATRLGRPGPNNGTYPLPGANGTAPGYAPFGSASCAVHGELVCNGEDLSALCNWGTAIWQPVADGTACENGAIVGTGIDANPPEHSSDSASADCSINGQLLCNGNDQFGLCNRGRVVWQPVAQGTQCQSGQIVRRRVFASVTPTPRAMIRMCRKLEWLCTQTRVRSTWINAMSSLSSL